MAICITIAILFCVTKLWIFYSEETIRKSLIQETPIGTNKKTIKKYIEHKNLKVLYISKLGFLTRDQRQETIGTSSIEVELFDEVHIFFWYFDVTCYWIFDKNDELIEINIWKQIDSI